MKIDAKPLLFIDISSCDRAKSMLITLLCLTTLSGCGGSSDKQNSGSAAFTSRSQLGDSLFHDVNLSLNRSQSCATCHDPDHAFIDDRTGADGKRLATSLGDDNVSLGDRNTPTAAYASFSPDFHQGSRSRFNSKESDYVGYLGGQFFDGRAIDLSAQAEGPFLNPIEMGMPDKASVVERLQENADYVSAFKSLYGIDVFSDVDTAYSTMTNAIASFEETDEFSPFDSKYDRSLTGDYVYNPLSKATTGKSLFFSQQFTSCATCHQLHPVGNKSETFTGYEYHNIGIPKNEEARLANGSEPDAIDNGLANNELLTSDPTVEKGKHKVPTLRNIAVTGPYMHNGVFRDLRTVLEFYDHFLDDSEHVINPETGLPWAEAEVPDNISLAELKSSPKLTDEDIDALICFLRTLTDARYEHLIEDDGLCE